MSNKNILIVDDEKDVCEALKESLSREGYSIDVCYTGVDAILLFSQNRYDLALIDIKLEGRMSGIDLIKRIVEIAPIPTIVVESATPKKQLEEILRKEGLLERVDKILEKPSDLRLDYFIHFVQQIISKRKG